MKFKAPKGYRTHYGFVDAYIEGYEYNFSTHTLDPIIDNKKTQPFDHPDVKGINNFYNQCVIGIGRRKLHRKKPNKGLILGDFDERRRYKFKSISLRAAIKELNKLEAIPKGLPVNVDNLYYRANTITDLGFTYIKK